MQSLSGRVPRESEGGRRAVGALNFGHDPPAPGYGVAGSVYPSSQRIGLSGVAQARDIFLSVAGSMTAEIPRKRRS